MYTTKAGDGEALGSEAPQWFLRVGFQRMLDLWLSDDGEALNGTVT